MIFSNFCNRLEIGTTIIYCQKIEVTNLGTVGDELGIFCIIAHTLILRGLKNNKQKQYIADFYDHTYN